MDERTKQNLKSAGKLTGYILLLGATSYGWVWLAGKIREEASEEVLRLNRGIEEG